MVDNAQEDNTQDGISCLLKIIGLALFIFTSYYLISLIPLPNPQVPYTAEIAACQNNLKQIRKLLSTYKNETGSFPPLDGGNNSKNWGEFLKNYYLSKQLDVKNLFVCPIKKTKPSKRHNDYLWADPKNKKYFPNGKLDGNVSEDTPIAGDKLNNHKSIGDNDPLILLKNGKVIDVSPGDELYKKSYGKNGSLNLDN